MYRCHSCRISYIMVMNAPAVALQVHPVVLRLCAPIEGTDAARLADCLGLDPAKYHAAAAGASVREAQEDALVASASALDDDARYKASAHQLPVRCAIPA